MDTQRTASAVPYVSPFANDAATQSSAGSRSPHSASSGSGAAAPAASHVGFQSDDAAHTAQQQAAYQPTAQPVVNFGCVAWLCVSWCHATFQLENAVIPER